MLHFVSFEEIEVSFIIEQNLKKKKPWTKSHFMTYFNPHKSKIS